MARDSEYSTFDHLKYDFRGEHSYVLVRSKNLPQNFQDVYVEAVAAQIHGGGDSSEEDRSRGGSDEKDEDEDEEDSEEQDGQHRLGELRIRVYNHTVEFRKNRRLVVSTGRTLIYGCFPPLSSSDEEHVQLLTSKKDGSGFNSHVGPSRVLTHFSTGTFKSRVFSQVDGRTVRPPVSPSAGLKIYERSFRIYLKSDFGLAVKFDGHGAAGN